MKRDLLVCACGDVAHQLVITTFGDGEAYVTFHLSKLKWYNRIWVGMRYIFGKQSKYGAFGEVVLDARHVEQLRALADELEDKKISFKDKIKEAIARAEGKCED